MAPDKGTSGKRTTQPSEDPPTWELPSPELIAVAEPEAGMRMTVEGPTAAVADTRPLQELLSNADATMHSLFGAREQRLQFEVGQIAEALEGQVPNLAGYYSISAPPGADLEELAEGLRGQDAIRAAYVKPPAEPAQVVIELPLADAPPAHTPDFTVRQGYLDAAPGGIDARHAWTLAGGNGAGVSVIDIEGAWRFTHEDLLQNQGGVIGGTQSTDIAWRNHGTAVVGEFGGDQNTFGVTGICPAANVRAISIFGLGSAAAVRAAANALNPGDIILIELHRPGPRHNFASRQDQLGYIAIEWWPDDFDAILFATGRGVIVVEAAGNGAEDLDDPLYNTPAPGFPAGWTNPFNRANRDSGAILVGAGAPPPGTHGHTHGADRSRLGFSNYGALVDAQGWGREVTSSGYGSLQGGTNEDEWYTDTFSGTSSASPIVVGAIGCVQGIRRARGRVALTPAQARQCLRSTGSPQQDEPGRPATQRIGNRPDIRQMINCGVKILKHELKEVQEKFEREENKLDKPEKFEKPERKELKTEAKELKDLKREKFETKEKFEFEKGFKERKPEVEGKVLAKEVELKGVQEMERIRGEGLIPSGEAALGERVAQLEEAVQGLVHFITGQMRPDLSQGALSGEPDIGDLTARLEKEAANAKQAKDSKDLEKMAER